MDGGGEGNATEVVGVSDIAGGNSNGGGTVGWFGGNADAMTMEDLESLSLSRSLYSIHLKEENDW